MKEIKTKQADDGRSWNGFWRKAEAVCKITSILTVLWLFVSIALAPFGIVLPDMLTGVMAIMLTAAVGYLTNYVAIEMLFKPYLPTDRHFLKYITLGLWRQGLVPSKKEEIGEKLGEQIETRLLDPNKIAEELCLFAGEFMDSPEHMARLGDAAASLLRDYEPELVHYLSDQVERSVKSMLDEFVTAGRFEEFYTRAIDPYLRREEVQRRITDAFLGFARKRSDEIVRALKEYAGSLLDGVLKQNALTAAFAEPIRNAILGAIKWDKVEWHIYDMLRGERIRNWLRDEIVNFLNHLRDRWHTPETQRDIEALLRVVREEATPTVQRFARERIPAMVKETIESERLKSWIRDTLIPHAKPQIETWIREHGKGVIVEKLNIRQRVKDAVDRQDIREFHGMVNNIAAEHLGAIQVLGYLLGGALGLLQFLLALICG